MKVKMNSKKLIASLLALSATACLSVGASAIIASAEGETAVDTYGLSATDAFEIYGAGIRFAEDELTSGIRFAIGVENSVYEKMQTADVLKDIKILLMPTAFVDGELDVDESYTANGVTVKPTGGAIASEWRASDDGKYMLSYAYIYEVPAAYFGQDISARAYYVDGETTIYTETTDKDNRSVAYVANVALNDTQDTQDTGEDAIYTESVVVNGETKYSPYTVDQRKLLDAYSMVWSYQSGAKTIYTANITLNDTEYSKTATYTLNATHRGSAITPTWFSEDETVATVVDGVVTAVGVGTTNVYAQYTVEVEGEMKTYTSPKKAVTVEMPVAETGKEIVFGSADTENPVVVSQFTDAEFTATGIINAADNTVIEYDATNNNVTATLSDGKYEWIIHNGEYGYKVNAWVATNVIRTAEDLQIFDFTIATNTFAGTYVLDNNIDASEYTHYTQKATANANGLQGTFDGRGYTIDGITLGVGGLFGNIGGGTVQNVAFTNVKLQGTHSYVLAYSVWYSAQINNVFVGIQSWPTDTAKITAAGLYGWIRQPKADTLIENIMIVAPAATGTVNAMGSLKVTVADEGGTQHTGMYSNVFVLSPVATNVNEVANYGSITTFKSSTDVSVLTSNVWDLTGEYPVFKTSEKVAPYTISISEETASVYEDETVTLTATALDLIGGDASALVEWTSSEPTVATVANGVVSGLTEGTTVITATLGNASASCTVTVEKMVEYVELTIDESNPNNLYTANVEIDGVTFSTTATYTATATLNNVAITEGLVWASDNTDVLTIDETTGVATVVGVGTANITVSYTGKSGEVYTSEPFAVEVTMPIIETGVEIVFGSADTENPVVVSQFTDNAEFTPTTIVNAADSTEIAYDTVNKNVTATLTEGKYEWIIHNSAYGYKVSVWVATNAIRTAEDLSVFSVPDATKNLAGTYVLANDIDATNYVHCMNIGWSSKANGLTGTFDGRGYTIDGITIRQGGLFGVISSGTVKNVAFTNVKLSAADDNGGTTGNHLYVLATLVWYGVTIDNVFVEIDSWAETASKTTAVLFHSVKKATPSISNVVIITPAATGNETKVEPVVCSAANATFANVYVISPVTGTAITGVTQYNDVATFKQNVTTSTLTGFNEYWDLTGDYPVISTAKAYLA